MIVILESILKCSKKIVQYIWMDNESEKNETKFKYYT